MIELRERPSCCDTTFRFSSLPTGVAYSDTGSLYATGRTVKYRVTTHLCRAALWSSENGTWILKDRSGQYYEGTTIPDTIDRGTHATGDNATLYPIQEGCGEPCEDEKIASRDSCGGDEFVDWSNWNNEECTGGVCDTIPEYQFGLTCPI